MTATHEGAKHLYHPPKDNEENANVQDVAPPLVSLNSKGNLGDIQPQRRAKELPKYIFVIFGDCNINNHLS